MRTTPKEIWQSHYSIGISPDISESSFFNISSLLWTGWSVFGGTYFYYDIVLVVTPLNIYNALNDIGLLTHGIKLLNPIVCKLANIFNELSINEPQ